jgi:hypothetical protein
MLKSAYNTMVNYVASLMGGAVLLSSSPTNGQVLTYNSGSGKYVNAAPSGGGGGTNLDEVLAAQAIL